MDNNYTACDWLTSVHNRASILHASQLPATNHVTQASKQASTTKQANTIIIIAKVYRHLCSARHHYLVVPRHCLSSHGRRAFAVAGPTVWNSKSDDLRDLTLSTDSFRCLLKMQLFSEY